MSHARQRQLLIGLIASLCLISLLLLRARSASGQRGNASVPPAQKLHGQRASATDFEAIVPVLRNPRCMNCHSSGNYPREGDDSHPHIMNVRRGPDGHGVNAVKCSTCHQDHNLAGVHMPPGAPGWALPSPATPMIWEGLSDHQLCLLLKDPHQNGHRNMHQIVEHMHTPLVLWGWNPGEGRTPVAMPQHEFLAKVSDWVDKGSTCPVDATAPKR